MLRVIFKVLITWAESVRASARLVKRSSSSPSAFRCSLKEMMPFSLHFGKAQVSRTIRRLFIIAHGDEDVMPQVSGISPFEECHLADQFRRDPAASSSFPQPAIRPTARPFSRASF